MENNDNFSFTYSAHQQKEVEDIRKKYLPKEENKMEQLRRLHAVPTQKAQAASLAVGILGALILGTGMSLAMTDIGAALGSLAMTFGIVIGVVGMVLPPDYFSLSNEEEQMHRQNLIALKAEQGIADDEFYHYDTPLTTKHETEALLEAGFSSVEVLKNWGATYTIKAVK